MKTYTKDNINLTIEQDVHPENPRELDNLSIMLCMHNSYNLGDKVDLDLSTCSSWVDVETAIHNTFKDILFCTPLYLYDHSGLSISSTPFSCPWDSGQIGFAFLRKSRIKDRLGIKKITEKEINQARIILAHEIEIYDQYLKGDVYGFTVTNASLCPHCSQPITELIDSCWGFYGTDWTNNGLAEQLGEYAYLLNT